MRKKLSKFKFCVVLTITVLLSSEAFSQGNLLITPRRIVFEGDKKIAEVNVANIGQDSARYVVSFMEMRMKEDGSFEAIETPDSTDNLASKYLRFFPRTIYLGPNEPQVVKIQLYHTEGLPSGEYRSHLYFRAVPKEKVLGEVLPPSKPGDISVKLTPIFGITIPVIIRKGATKAAISFSDIRFQVEKDSIPSVSMTFNRTGNRSVYGDVTIDHISKDGKTTRVFLAKGLAVYTPNKLRHLKALLDNHAGADYHSGSLLLKYTAQNEAKDELAEEKIELH
jgi:P pilus assembly chaperone PapD